MKFWHQYVLLMLIRLGLQSPHVDDHEYKDVFTSLFRRCLS